MLVGPREITTPQASLTELIQAGLASQKPHIPTRDVGLTINTNVKTYLVPRLGVVEPEIILGERWKGQSRPVGRSLELPLLALPL